MSTETCKLCHKDCTPWVQHSSGHICFDCYFNTKQRSDNDCDEKSKKLPTLKDYMTDEEWEQMNNIIVCFECKKEFQVTSALCRECSSPIKYCDWISIENSKIPEIYNKPVLVTDGHVIDIASLRFIDGHLRAWDKNKLKNGVIYWMPLPSPPDIVNET